MPTCLPAGKILDTASHPLSPPGLVFGCAGETMVATPLTQSLPSVVGAVEELLKDPNNNTNNVKAALKVQWKQRHKN